MSNVGSGCRVINGDVFAGKVCFDDRASGEGQRTVAARFTVETAVWAIENYPEPAELRTDIWEGLTHLFFQGLLVTYEGEVTDQDLKVLASPRTYVKYINDLVKSNDVQLVWSLPSNDPYMFNAVASNRSLFYSSLKTMCAKYNITSLEVDYRFFSGMLLEENDWLMFPFDILEKVYVTVDSHNMQNNADMDLLKAVKEHLGGKFAVVMKSFGFMAVSDLQTSHGTFRTTHVYPDSSLTIFNEGITILKSIGVEVSNVIMEIDTCGVEFITQSSNVHAVKEYRIITLRAIRHMKMFGKNIYNERFDSRWQYCMLEFPNMKTVISYDNDEVRTLKLQYVVSEGLQGVLMGPLQHDLAPQHPSSLFNWTAAILNKHETSM
jgi:hypothetical protein